MSIRKLLNHLLCESYYISIYHQRLSANAIVAERSMTSVSTDKMMHKFKHYNKREEVQIEIYPSVCRGGATSAYI